MYPSHTGELSNNKKKSKSPGSSEEIFWSFTSFPAVQWNLQASQSFSPHRSRFSQRTPRDNLNYLIPSLSPRTASLQQPERGNMSERQREVRSQSRCLLLRDYDPDWLTDWLTDGQKSDFRSSASQSHTQHSPPKHNNNTTTSSIQHFRGERTEGRTVWEEMSGVSKKKKKKNWRETSLRGILVSPKMKKCRFKPSVWAAHATEMC